MKETTHHLIEFGKRLIVILLFWFCIYTIHVLRYFLSTSPVGVGLVRHYRPQTHLDYTRYVVIITITPFSKKVNEIARLINEDQTN